MFTNDVICSLTWRQMTEIEVEWLVQYENFNLEPRSFHFNISSKALISVRTNVNNKPVMESRYIFYKWLALSLNKICKLVSSIDVVNCGGYGIITLFKALLRFLLHMWYTTWYTIWHMRIPRILTRSPKLRGTRTLA